MRALLTVAVVAGLAGPALAGMNTGQMDLLQGPYTLTADDGGQCALTLGDEPVNGGRHLDGGPDCRRLDVLFENAAGWRIDTPTELVIVNGSGKPLLKMRFVSADETFRTSEDRDPALILAPAQ